MRRLHDQLGLPRRRRRTCGQGTPTSRGGPPRWPRPGSGSASTHLAITATAACVPLQIVPADARAGKRREIMMGAHAAHTLTPRGQAASTPCVSPGRPEGRQSSAVQRSRASRAGLCWSPRAPRLAWPGRSAPPRASRSPGPAAQRPLLGQRCRVSTRGIIAGGRGHPLASPRRVATVTYEESPPR